MEAVSTKKKHIDELHFEHQLWANESKFYTDELKIYRKWLEGIASKNTSIDARKQIERFQNQFIIQKEQLDILNHEINVHEQWLSKIAEENPLTIALELFADHATMYDRMIEFRKIYANLKEELNRFVAEWR